VIHCYGDSAAANGGWVDEERIIEEIRDPSVFEGDARRFFLNQIVAGQSDFVDPLLWDALVAEEDLHPKDRVCLGFDGSRSDDHTVIWISRVEDGRLFRGGWWAPREIDGQWRVPRDAVDLTMRSLFKVYRIEYLFCDPFKWQDYIDRWNAEWPGRVVEFPTNVEKRMDDAIERFLQSVKSQELSHDGDSVLTEHVRNAVLVNGSRKRDREVGKSEFHRKLSKKRATVKIDAAIAAVLAYSARGFALENGAARVRRARVVDLSEIDI
jgi:phage terminase large subunit-like protein